MALGEAWIFIAQRCGETASLHACTQCQSHMAVYAVCSPKADYEAFSSHIRLTGSLGLQEHPAREKKKAY